MPSEKLYAVITGDVVHSSKLNINDRVLLLQNLKSVFHDIESYISHEKIKFPFEIFRGDSFQITLNNPASAFLVMILLRTGIRKAYNLPLKNMIDLRLAAGIGFIDEVSELRSGENDGEAYRLSGNEIDRLSRIHQRMAIVTTHDRLNEELTMYLILLDQVFLKISAKQSEAIYWSMMDKTQVELAAMLNIRQSSLNDRLIASGFEAIKMLNHRINAIFSAL